MSENGEIIPENQFNEPNELNELDQSEDNVNKV